MRRRCWRRPLLVRWQIPERGVNLAATPAQAHTNSAGVRVCDTSGRLPPEHASQHQALQACHGLQHARAVHERPRWAIIRLQPSAKASIIHRFAYNGRDWHIVRCFACSNGTSVGGGSARAQQFEAVAVPVRPTRRAVYGKARSRADGSCCFCGGGRPRDAFRVMPVQQRNTTIAPYLVRSLHVRDWGLEYASFALGGKPNALCAIL